jgi:hypothetical protein
MESKQRSCESNRRQSPANQADLLEKDERHVICNHVWTSFGDLADVRGFPMKTNYWFLLAALAVGLTLGRAFAQDDDAIVMADADVPEGVEVLTRGPIHEAFAMPVTGEVKPTFVVPKEPPADIDEVPPDYKPEGEDAVWIPGYWSWDDEREDFIWVSGVWRRTPPKQRWVPGYWDKVDEGWGWTPGFWTPIAEETITYYDPPPETLEEGPTSTAPGDNYFWTPGVWTYYDTGYRWRPGYWAVSQPNWIWIPDRWVWTPSGAVFIPGFWDYTLATRGCAFSPVYISQTVYAQPNFYWRPRFALNTAAMLVNFWVRPNYCHYYFGNYYGGNYGQWGYTPMASYWGRSGGWGWDPIIAYNQAYYRGRGINYVNRMNDWHQFYVNHPNRRPPATWRDQVNIVQNKKVTINNISNITNVNHIIDNDVNVIDNSANIMALPVDKVARARRNDPDLKFAKINDRQRDQARERARQIQTVNQERIKAERENAITARDRQPKPDADRKKGQVRSKVKLPAVAKVADDTPVRDRPGRNTTPGRDEPGRPGRDTARDDRPGRESPAGRDARTGLDTAREDRPKVRDDRPTARDTARDFKPRERDAKPDARDTARPDRDTTPGRDTPTARDDRPGSTLPGRDARAGKDRPGRDTPTAHDDRPSRDKFGGRDDGPDRDTAKPERRPKMIVDPPAPRLNRSDARPEPRVERPATRPNGAEARPDPRRSDKPEVQTEPRPKPESRPEPRRESRPEPRVERRPEPRPQPHAESRPQARQESRPQPRAELRTRPESRPESRSQPKGKGRNDSRPEPHTALRPQSRPEPRPQPRAESRPQLQREPRTVSRPQPRPESRPEPRAASRPKPRPETSRPSGGGSRKAESGGGRPDGGSKGKGKDKDKK